MVKKIYSKHYQEPVRFRVPPVVLYRMKALIKNRLAVPLLAGLVFAAVVAGFTLSIKNKPEIKSASKSLVFQRQLVGSDQYVGEIKGVMKTALGVKKDGGRVTVSRGGSSLEFTIPIDNPTLNSQDVGILQATDVSFASKDKIIASKYNLLPNGIKEEIILNKIPKENTFPLTIKTENLEVKINPDNIPVFYDREGKYQFHFERPFVKDGSGQVSYGIRYRFINQNNKSPELFRNEGGKDTRREMLGGNLPLPSGQYTLNIEVDSDWLHDPKRVLPIIIDPTVVHDESSEFATGQFNRVLDTGSGTSPVLETYYQELAADEHTVGLWHMNEASGNVLDSSGNGNTGTPTGTTVVSGLLNNARSFNGSSDYIQINSSPSLNTGSEITIEAWIKPSGSSTQPIVEYNNGSTYGVHLWQHNAFDKLFVNFFDTAGTGHSITSPAGQFVTGNWYHVAATYDGMYGKLYVNGLEVASTNLGSFTLQTSYNLAIGRRLSGANYFNGLIDEVRISNTARSPEEIKSSASHRPYSTYTSDVLDLTKVASWNSLSWTELGVTTGDGETLKDSTSLVAQWNFNETSGTTADNAAGSCGATCDGTLTNFASTTSQDQAAGTGWTSANRRWGAGALMFDGTNDYVACTDANCGTTSKLDFDASQSFSYGTWVQTSKTGTAQVILSKQSTYNASVGWSLWIFSDNKVYCNIHDGTNNAWAVSSTSVTDGKWYYIACNINRSTNEINLYVDGRYEGLSYIASVGSLDTTSDFRFGSQGSGGTYFQGSIDSTSVYSRVLSSSEILSNYNATNVELQTRVGDTTTPDDGTWEAWRPTTSETVINSFDSDQPNWTISSPLVAKPAVIISNSNPTAPTGPTSCSSSLPVVVNNFGNDTSLTNYPVKLQFDYRSGMSSNFSDIRFTNSSGTNLDYWLETYTTSSKATTWIEVDSLVANRNTTIYMWYNGCTGGNASNGTNTFSFFDNFDTLDTGVWSVQSGSSYTVSSSTLQITVGAIGMVDPLGFNLNDGYMTEGRVRYDTLSETQYGGVFQVASSQFIAGSNGNADSTILYMLNSGASATEVRHWIGNGLVTGYNVSNAKTAFNAAQSTWYILGDETTPTSAGVWKNYGTMDKYPMTWSKNLNYISLGYFSGSGIVDIKDTSYDWVRVRKFSSVEPTAEIALTTPAVTSSGGSMLLETGKSRTNPSTIGLWNFDETGGTGAYLKDSSGNANHGTPTGTTVIDGVSGKARSFNGSTDYVTLGDLSLIDNTAKLTVEAWLYTTTSDANHHRVFTETNVLYVGQYSNQVSFYMGNGSSWVNYSVAMGTLTTNAWHHVVWVKNGTTASVYIDGVFSNSMDAPVTLGSSTNINYFGGVATTQPWGGKLDEIKISNTALTAEEIAENYRAGRDYAFSKTISSTDLSGKQSLPFYIAADRPGTYLEAIVGESSYANYQSDANTVGLWRMEEQGGTMPTFFDYDSFEGGPGSSDDWADRNETDPNITNTTAFTGNYSLHMPRGFGRNFEGASGEPTNAPYDTNTYPYICMAYKIPSTTIVNMLIYINEIPGWRSITMTQGETPTTYAKVASWNPLTVDNTWQYKCINLDSQLDASLGTGTHSINSMIWHDGGGTPNITGEFWIDDFIISSAPYYPQGTYARDTSNNSKAAYSVPSSLVSATGGTITSANGYQIHTFTSSGTLTVSGGTTNGDALVIAGGGGGGATGSGGGAGGLLYSSLPLSSQAYSVTVGGGGAGGIGNSTWHGSNGSNSIFSTLTAIGGGRGITHGGGSGTSGGSGGGGAIMTSGGTPTGGAGTTGQGNAGGAGYVQASWIGNSGGGGGAGGVGAAGGNTAGTGNGGVGRPSSISGTTTFYAGGGGGGEVSGSYVGTGGVGGGGNSTLNGAGTNGTANTGGGGGGGSYDGSYYNGGSGGSGIVVVRYPRTQVMTQSNIIGTSPTQGKMGKARYFNGTTDSIIVGNESVYNFERTDSFTIDAWINPSAASQGIIFAKRQPASPYAGYELRRESDGKLTFILSNTSTSNMLMVQTVNAVNINEWHHVAATYNGTSDAGGVKIYIDGIEQSLTTTYNSLSASTTNSEYAYIGSRSYTIHFAGLIDEVRISNIARTAEEIRQAYEVGLRSHPITIDFAASLDSGNLIANSSDVSFTVDATPYGLTNKGSKLYSGDKLIVRENYDGTEYIAQGTVTSVNESTGATTVASWDAGSTFPSSGYTANASVFKWQREYWNITEPMDGHINAVTNLSLRLLDGNEGRTIWIDDLQSSGDYLTTPAGSTITSSTGKRYFQYRVVQHSSDENVSASLTSATLDYVQNSKPNPPQQNAPSDTVTNQSLTPILQMTTTDPDSDYVRYQIELCTDLAMTTNCQTFDQTSSQTGWSGQNTESNTAYTSGTQATYTVQTPLTTSTTYYWQAAAIDPGGINTWSDYSNDVFSFTTTNSPSSPTTPHTEGATNPTGVTDTTPEFSAVVSDPDGDNANYYRIEVNTQSNFLGTSMWDSGKTSMTTTANGVRSPDISYAGTAIPLDGAGTTYYWRIKFWDVNGAEGSYTTAQSFTMNVKPNTPSLDSPTNGATDQDYLVTLKTTATDNNSDNLKYKIELCSDLAMTSNCQTFDQTSSQTGWSGQNADTNTTYTSGTQASYTVQSVLDVSTTYYWRSYAIDPSGSNTWSTTQGAPYSFTTTALNHPTSCQVEKAPDNSYLTIKWNDNSTTEVNYEIQKNTDNGGFSLLQTLAANSVSHQDNSVSNGHTYQYRVAAIFSGSQYSQWCTTSTVSLSTSVNTFGIN